MNMSNILMNFRHMLPLFRGFSAHGKGVTSTVLSDIDKNFNQWYLDVVENAKLSGQVSHSFQRSFMVKYDFIRGQ